MLQGTYKTIYLCVVLNKEGALNGVTCDKNFKKHCLSDILFDILLIIHLKWFY